MASHLSRKSGSPGSKLKKLEAVLHSSGSIEYIGDLSDEQRMAGIKAFAEMFKRFVNKNAVLKKGMKQLTGPSHSRRSQRGGGMLDGEFAEEIRDTEARIRRLQEQMDADPENLVNPQKEFLVRDYREYIKEMKKWRQFHNYVYMLSIPLLAPQFARMLLALVVHVLAFTAATVPMGGATTFNLLVSFMGHLFSPLNRVTKTLFGGAGNMDSASEIMDDHGMCRPGYRTDLTLGCVKVFTPDAAAPEAPWTLDVTKIGHDVIDSVTFNLKQTLAEPLHGIVAVALGAVMLWRLHQLVQYEENLFKEKLERMKAAQRESVRQMSVMEQTARTAHTAALAAMGPAFAQVGNSHALQLIANGIFRMSAPAQQALLTGSSVPMSQAVGRIADAPRAALGSPRTTSALEGLLALSAGPTRRRRGSTAGP